MGRVCTICAHPARDAIDGALETDRPLRDIALQFSISKTALHRHWQAHVPGRALSHTGASSTGAAQQRGSRFWTFVKWGLVIGAGVLVWRGASPGRPPQGA
jgi:hypothetical protein